MQGWKRTKLISVLAVQNGFAFDSKAFGSSGMPLIRIRDLKSGESTETRYRGEFDAKYVVNAGDLLVGMDGEFACYEWKGEPALLNQRVCRLQGFGDALNPRFLFYGINKHLKAIEDVTGFTTVKHLSSKQILDIDFFVPSKAEQRRIVAILDEAFEAIATAKTNTEKKVESAQGILRRCLADRFSQTGSDWRRGVLRDLTTKIGSGATPLGGEAAYKQQGIALVRSLNVHDRGFRYGKLAFLDEEQAARLANVQLQTDDVLLNITGASIARCCVLPTDVLPARVNQHVSIIRPRKGVLDSEFLHWLLIAPPNKERLLGIGTGAGATRQAITKAEIEAFEIKYPGYEEQQAVAASLDELALATDHVGTICTAKLTALDELKKSLLHQAFTGQLTAKSADRQLEAVS